MKGEPESATIVLFAKSRKYAGRSLAQWSDIPWVPFLFPNLTAHDGDINKLETNHLSIGRNGSAGLNIVQPPLPLN